MKRVQAINSTRQASNTPKKPFLGSSWVTVGGQYSTWLLLLATVAGRLGAYFFLFELASHFAVQYAVVALCLLVYWAVQRRPLALVAAGCLAWHSYQVLPWLLAEKPASATTKMDIRVLHANVLFTRTEMQTTIAMIRRERPDIFVLQEMTPGSIQTISDALGNEYPYRDTVLAKDPCFLLVASRTPFLADRQAMRNHRVIHIMTTIKDHDVSFITLHPRTPIVPSWFAERNRQLAFVNKKIREVPHPAVLIGDCNVSVFSPVYADLFENEPGLTACRKGFGLNPTWPSYLPPAMLPIDHAFVNSGFQTVNFRTLYQSQSDHKAVVVDLAFANAQ